MQREFLQEKSINRNLDNAEKSVNVDLSAKSRLIPLSTTAGMLSLYKLYTEERDACERYRMIFTVNPICTNVLYNAVTEPVYKEGSYSALTLVEAPVRRDNTDIFPSGTTNQSGETIDQIAAIRDTEISHEKIGGFKYHCGYDIFNNHLLRTNEFEHVSETNDKSPLSNKDVFNTLEDYAVDYSGKIVERVIGEGDGPLDGKPASNRAKVRLYSLDTIKSMNTAFYDELREVDGWYGFYNSGYINIPNCKLGGEDISVNRVLNNETPCGFIDLYPGRTLYSFIPNVNRFKKRLERNWDCTIVYPFESDRDLFDVINDNGKTNAVKILSARVVYDNAGNPQIQMLSLFRHTLKGGDKIRLFYSNADDTGNTITRYSMPVTVIGVGNEKGSETDRYFKIKHYDIRTFCDILEDEETGEKKIVIKNTNNEINFFYRKIESGCDDRYYFRKFKKIKCNGKDLEYTQNKIAFANNIYGDRVAQVIFNDDICVDGLKDNLGRPLTKVYFMVEKTNRGYKEWYESGETTDDAVEYSHCFGDVTSGLDLPSGVTDYNVRCLYNVFKDDLTDTGYSAGLNLVLKDAPEGDYSGTPMPIEIGLTMSGFDEFYGDVVEFSSANFTEKIIEKVYHRFNTAQRECVKNSNYFDVHYDELIGDIYDINEN